MYLSDIACRVAASLLSLSLSLSRELETREGVSLYRCDTGTTCRTLSSYVNPEAAGPLTDSLTHREKFLRVHVPRYVLYYVPLLSTLKRE